MASPLSGKTVLITSGPTREHLDPIRFMTNASSGRMGFALAREAKRLGARAVVVSGPTEVPPPAGVEVRRVTSAREMLAEALKLSKRADVVIGAAAVSDWRFARAAERKLKRGPGALRLTLLPNPDIIKTVAERRPAGRRQIVVGFALETHDRLAYARRKLVAKRLDAVVANGPANLGAEGAEATWMTREASKRLPKGGKDALARAILKEIETIYEP